MAALALAALGLTATAGDAAFPGRNGPIAFRGDAAPAKGLDRHAIWIVKPDGSGTKRVTKGTYPTGYLEIDYSPVFFPDGRRFAYVRQLISTELEVENQIFVKSLSEPANATGTPVLPTAVTYKILSLAIAPDGRDLVIAAPARGGMQIFNLPLDGSEMTQLTFGPAASGPEFSPDGRQIVFATRAHHKGGLALVNSDGTGLRQLTARPGDGAPSFSPSGARIVFNRHTDGDPHIFSMRANGGDLTQLTSGPFVDRGPVFSPDGRSIVFSRFGGGGNSDLYVTRADGTGTRLLYASPGASTSDLGPDWGPKPR